MDGFQKVLVSDRIDPEEHVLVVFPVQSFEPLL